MSVEDENTKNVFNRLLKLAEEHRQQVQLLHSSSEGTLRESTSLDLEYIDNLLTDAYALIYPMPWLPEPKLQKN